MFTSALQTQSATVEAGTSRKNLHGLRNKTHESSDRMPIHTMSEENFEVSDEMLVAAAARALTPDPVKPAKSKRGPKKGTRSEQSVESADLFQNAQPSPTNEEVIYHSRDTKSPKTADSRYGGLRNNFWRLFYESEKFN